MFFFINNTNNKRLLAVHRTSIGCVRRNSIGSGHFGGWFVVSPLTVRRKSPLDCEVRPEMLRPAPENHQKNTVVKKHKNMDSAYPQSDGVRSEKQWECKDLPISLLI